MWSSLLANFKPKSGYHLVLVVVYYLVFTLSVCYSENVTSNVIIPSESKSVNSSTSSGSTLLLLKTINTINNGEISTSPTTVIPSGKIASSMLKRLTTIRPNVTTNSASGSTNGLHSKNTSTTSKTEKDSSRNVRPKPKQTTSHQQQQQSSQSKVLSWPSKPGGTYLIEGDFQYNSRYIFIVFLLLLFFFSLFPIFLCTCRLHVVVLTAGAVDACSIFVIFIMKIAMCVCVFVYIFFLLYLHSISISIMCDVEMKKGGSNISCWIMPSGYLLLLFLFRSFQPSRLPSCLLERLFAFHSSVSPSIFSSVSFPFVPF